MYELPSHGVMAWVNAGGDISLFLGPEDTSVNLYYYNGWSSYDIVLTKTDDGFIGESSDKIAYYDSEGSLYRQESTNNDGSIAGTTYYDNWKLHKKDGPAVISYYEDGSSPVERLLYRGRTTQ